MKTPPILRATSIIALILLSSSSVLLHAQTQSGSKSMPIVPGVSTEAMHRAMMSGTQRMSDMKPSGDPDKDFAAMMKVQHEQAIDMANAELAYGKSAELKNMAKKIVAAQKKEIARLDNWLKKHP